MGRIGVARPPMGWNSWDCYGTSVREEEVLANARHMAQHLAPYGWDTVVIDIDWADPTAKAHGFNPDPPLVMDAWGRLLPDPVRFPSAADGTGFTHLAGAIHDLGLKFGIHIMRGIPRRAVDADSPVLGTAVGARAIAVPTDRCPWNPDMDGIDAATPAGQAYYDSIAALYAEWGIDYLKADDMLYPYHAAEIDALARAIARTGRPMTLSLSPGRDVSLARLEHLRATADLWRISDDVWDRWEDIEANVARFARWAPHASPSGWPDGDMLPLGHIGLRGERGDDRPDRLTPDERRTMMTLWAIARSPLMVGGDLPTSDPAVLALLAQPDVLALQARGRDNAELLREDGVVLWGARVDDEPVAALFNLGETQLEYALDLGDAGFGDRAVRDVWSGTVMSPSPGRPVVTCHVPSHGVVLLRVA